MRRIVLAGLLAGAVVELAGCDGSADRADTTTVTVDATTSAPAVPTASAPAAPVTVTVTSTAVTPATSAPVAAPSSTPTASDPAPASATGSCAATTAQQARDGSIHLVPRSEPDWAWDTRTEQGLEGYDPCAALSWVIVGIEGATASSPFAVMLFHDGRYIGRASAVNFGFYPRVARLEDTTLQITYTYARPGEANANASGRAVGTFRWDEAQQKVVQTGEWPPR